ncbi:MAG: hypothetical protein HQL31_09165 [Planctomycetes bacterium]|nr:hypothetical protein [Planctomycetota bacterium]
MACRNTEARALVALGLAGPVKPTFESAVDVPNVGALCALPALVANGLFHGVEDRFEQPKGYYPLVSMFLMFALLAISRVKSLEQLRYLAPGEWGRLFGLDRIPEVKTLRHKLDALTKGDGVVAQWAEALSRFWMRLDEALAGILYVDGHVRLYHGHQTVLPRRYSSSRRLCLPSLMDYWVSDRVGTPFFVVTAVGNEGMLHYLNETILPRLRMEVPSQPSDAELAADPTRSRFTLIMDREGYSPKFFAELWTRHRIAVITYRRGTSEAWPEEAFTQREVVLVHGNKVEMRLAERDVMLDGAEGVAIREIRRLSDDGGHQTAILTTDQATKTEALASHMFARWCQENFFKYASRELGIDALCGYELDEGDLRGSVINPAYKRLDSSIRKLRATLVRAKVDLAELPLKDNEQKSIEAFFLLRAQLAQRIEDLEAERLRLCKERKSTPRRIEFKDLPEQDRPMLIAPKRNQFMNTIRIIAYRAETAMAIRLREYLARDDDARNVLKDLYSHDGDLLVDRTAKTITVRLHHFTNRMTGRAIAALLDELNQTETVYPGTNLRIFYELVSSPNPAGQEV